MFAQAFITKPAGTVVCRGKGRRPPCRSLSEEENVDASRGPLLLVCSCGDPVTPGFPRRCCSVMYSGFRVLLALVYLV